VVDLGEKIQELPYPDPTKKRIMRLRDKNN